MERFQFCELFCFDAKSNNTVDLQINGHKWLIRKKIVASAVESNSNLFLLRDEDNPIHTILELERSESSETVNVHLKLLLLPRHLFDISLKKFTKIVTIPKHQKKIEIFVSKNDFELYAPTVPLTFSGWLIGTVSVTPLMDTLSFMSEDFAQLLDSGASSDFVLRCDGQEFHVHKCILAARSSVFAAMFRFYNKNVKAQDPSNQCAAAPNAEAMEGRKRKKLEDSFQETTTAFNAEDIVDMKPDILKKMLQYIYSDRIDNLTSTDAMDLLYGADKYQLTHLKEICVKKLKSTLSPNNVLDILVIGDLHDQSLKAHAMEFIVNKYSFSELKKIDKWKSLQTTHPTLAIEVLTFVVETVENLHNYYTSNQLFKLFKQA